MKDIFKLNLISALALLMAIAIVSCEDGFDNDTDADDPAIPLMVADTSVKAPGRGQYKLKVLSGEEINVRADLSDISPVSSLVIKKTLNRVVDPSFGTNGTLTVAQNDIGSSYEFNYVTDLADIDQLVGFTFEATASDGKVTVSDLTLIVTLSPRDNIPQKRWAWTDKIWVDGNNAPDLKDCEKDNFTYYNADGSMSIDYGADTGAGDCAFDGFNIYHSWELSEDGKFFTTTRSGLFDPTVITETYRVVSLTTEKMVLEIDLDLSIFGLGTEETYRYEYTAMPK